MATGELRATMALTEPGGGSDLQAMRTVAEHVDSGYRINGSKTWITNARRSDAIALLCKTDRAADPAYRGMSILLVHKVSGLSVAQDLRKLGYKGVESCELSFEDCVVPHEALLGHHPGLGFSQMMRGLELGRILVAARAVGVAQAALNDALLYAQEREAFGVPIWRHQSIGNYLAEMATKVRAARLLTLAAAKGFDAGRRVDLEAGMPKLYSSEACMEVVRDAMRIYGGYGYSSEFNIERYYRDAPLMVIGEGTNEIQRTIIARQLVERGSNP